jgi:hypothetical protein
MAQHWRVAGMTYLRYSNTCAELLRRVIKPSVRAEVKQAVPFSMTRAEWEDGKIKKRSTLSRQEYLRALAMLIALACARPSLTRPFLLSICFCHQVKLSPRLPRQPCNAATKSTQGDASTCMCSRARCFGLIRVKSQRSSCNCWRSIMVAVPGVERDFT